MLLNIIMVIGVLFFLVSAVYLAIRDFDTEPLALLWGVPVVFGVWLVVAGIIGTALPKQPVYERYELRNIEDGRSLSGSFFLGTGGFDEGAKFYYYASKDGQTKLRDVTADQAEIYETTDKSHVMQRTDCTSRWEWLAECVYWDDYAKFYVPDGAIKTNYQLDAR